MGPFVTTLYLVILYDILFHIHPIFTQYIVSTKLISDKSEVYCSSHCESELGSIHNEQQFQNIQQLSNHEVGAGIWMGLNAKPHPNYQWIDETPFDYGKDYGIHPWQSSEPQGFGIQCVAMDSNFEWIATDCTTPKRPLCNHCNGIINKYSLQYTDAQDIGYTYSEAQSACDSQTLASIHTDRDMAEAKGLCSLLGNDCWIGLNDINDEAIYIYDDGTPFKYLSNLITKHNEFEDCIHLSSINNYTFEDFNCDGLGSISYALCYLPSELCSVHTMNWETLKGQVDGDCIKYLHEATDIVMSETLYWNGPDILQIDYMFRFILNDPLQIGDSGLIVYNSLLGSICEYYYIFVSKVNTNQYNLGLLYHTASSTTILSIIPIGFIENNDYLLSIYIQYSNIFSISIDGIPIMFYDHSINTNIRHDGYSGYIGLRTSHFITATAKSLYISGTAWTESNSIHKPLICPTSSPTEMTSNPTETPTLRPSVSPTIPTINPSFQPTDFPSIYPTKFPTIEPTTNPTVNPTFDPTYHPSQHPTINPTLPPSVDPTINPTSNPSIPTISPTKYPTHSPSKKPTAPTSIDIGSVVTADMVITVNRYNLILMEMIFHDTFSRTDSNKIVYILSNIISDLINEDCGHHDILNPSVFQKGRLMIINSSIITCDVSRESALLKSINGRYLQEKLISNIWIETNIQIVFRSNNIIFAEMVSTTNDIILSESNNNLSKLIQYEWLSWLVKIILVQLVLCCFLILCILGIRINTRKLNKKRIEIEEQLKRQRVGDDITTNHGENEENEEENEENKEQNKDNKENKDKNKYKSMLSLAYNGDHHRISLQEDEGSNDPHSTQRRSFKITRLLQFNHPPQLKWNNSGGISTFNMPNFNRLAANSMLSVTEHSADSKRMKAINEKETFKDTSDDDTSDHSETDDDNLSFDNSSDTRTRNFYLKELMTKTKQKIMSQTQNFPNFGGNNNKEKDRLKTPEIEMEIYGDGMDEPCSMKSTYPENKTILIGRIETDNTFPSIPDQDRRSNNNQSFGGIPCDDDGIDIDIDIYTECNTETLQTQQPIPESFRSDPQTPILMNHDHENYLNLTPLNIHSPNSDHSPITINRRHLSTSSNNIIHQSYDHQNHYQQQQQIQQQQQEQQIKQQQKESICSQQQTSSTTTATNDGSRKGTFGGICEKCGTQHNKNFNGGDQNGSCSPFIKFHANTKY